MDKKYAIGRYNEKNGVQGFDLCFDDLDLNYGHYPCDSDRFQESMTAAMADALDYGYYGILFEGSWKAK